MAETSSSLLGLLLEQQANGVAGLRLSLHSTFADPLKMVQHPYHYCGMQNRLDLALWLYQSGLAVDVLPVATVSADGVEGATRWNKTVSVTPQEAALIAGHAGAATALGHMEAGVPLAWSPQSHHRFPAPFRAEARQVVGALCSSPWFSALPGPARSSLVEGAVRDLARTRVWGMVQAGWWAQGEAQGVARPALEPSEVKALTTLLPGLVSVPPAAGDTGPAAAAAPGGGTHGVYQIQIGQPRPRRGPPVPWIGALVHRVVLPLAVSALALRCRPSPGLLLAYAAGAASSVSLPGATLILAQLLWGPSLQSL
mmetsp:Transcript_6773/g.16869  ORF Transcript_6773/g.16869 Transcript_6773/m.16869 type:complete len:312 (-) Transcript_6773:408-1343(-)